MDINLELERLNKSKNDILDKLVTCRDINVIKKPSASISGGSSLSS